MAKAGNQSYPLTLAGGWNMLGNGTTVSLDVKATFGAQSSVTSIWKWNAATGTWAFYSPALDADNTLATYAMGKGYAVLTAINPGEGYWVNASAPLTLGTQSGVGVSLAAGMLAKGWNLAATGDAATPAAFSAAIGNVATLWAWDAATGRWYFYAPSLAASNSLAGYIAGKSYLDFGSGTLDNGRGFWVNYGGGNGPLTAGLAFSSPYLIVPASATGSVTNLTATPLEQGVAVSTGTIAWSADSAISAHFSTTSGATTTFNTQWQSFQVSGGALGSITANYTSATSAAVKAAGKLPVAVLADANNTVIDSPITLTPCNGVTTTTPWRDFSNSAVSNCVNSGKPGYALVGGSMSDGKYHVAPVLVSPPLGGTPGATWANCSATSPTPNASAGGYAIIWDGSQFVAAAAGVVTSPDGYAWTTVYSAKNFVSIAFSGTRYAAIDNNNGLWVSNGTDLTSWTAVNYADSGPKPFIAVYYLNGRFIVKGYGVVASTDGTTWTTASITGGDKRNYPRAVASGTTLLISDGNFALTSTDGLAWTTTQISPRLYFNNAMVWDGNRFVALSTSGLVYTSTNGINWTKISNGVANNASSSVTWNDLAWTGSQYIAIGYDGNYVRQSVVFTSPDGIAWTAQAPVVANGKTLSLNNMAFAPALNRAVALGSFTNSGTFSGAAMYVSP